MGHEEKIEPGAQAALRESEQAAGDDRYPSEKPEALKRRQDRWKEAHPDAVRLSFWIERTLRAEIDEEYALVIKEREARGEPHLNLQAMLSEIIRTGLNDARRARRNAEEIEFHRVLESDNLSASEAVEAALNAA